MDAFLFFEPEPEEELREEREGGRLVIYNILPSVIFFLFVWECQGSLEVSSGGSGSAEPDVGDWS